MGYKERKATDTYANYGRYYIRYDKNTFSCGYEGKGDFWKDVSVAFKNKDKIYDAASMETAIRQPDFEDYTLLEATYNGDVTAKLSFKVERWGISCTAELPEGYTPVFKGEVKWGKACDRFAVRLNTDDGILRSAVGPAVSRVDDALFDRKTDSAVYFNCTPYFKYDWEQDKYFTDLISDNWFIGVKERVYQDKFAVNYKPVNKNNTYPKPPVGWMTWYAVRFDACEEVVLKNARWMKENLADFGANTVWVDWEWYHSRFDTVEGAENIHYFSPDPVRYPHGMKYVADKIKEMGLIPALWIGITHQTAKDDIMKAKPEIILADHGAWCGEYFFDLTNETYKREYVPAAIKKVTEWNYKAVKWDCLPVTQLITDRYHEYLFSPETTTDKALWEIVKIVRGILGEDFYMLSCAGAADREIRFAMDLFDGARIGGDIFTWQEFIDSLVKRVMRFYVYHNVQLYCDPDNVVVREEYNNYFQSVSRASLVSVLGLPFTFGDDLTELPEERVEILRRTIPSLDARPVDIRETSLKGKIMIVNQTVAKDFEQWNIVNILNLNETEAEKEIFLEELYLDDGKYLIYEFWGREFIGIADKSFTFKAGPCQTKTFAVRKLTGKPQIVSTNRHISQGYVDIVSVSYNEETRVLRGISSVVKGDEYVITAYDPFEKRIITHSFMPRKTGDAEWEIKFRA